MIANSTTFILAAHLAIHAGQLTVGAAAPVCPKAPSAQVQSYANSFTSWAKWLVIVTEGIMSTSSVTMLIWGRTTHHPKGARLGFDGIMICFVGAVAYVVVPPILSGITGSC